MMRRCIESQDGLFGMCGSGEEGADCLRFGTLLRIGRYEFSSDGRSLIEAQVRRKRGEGRRERGEGRLERERGRQFECLHS